jgi:hypothetical protein
VKDAGAWSPCGGKSCGDACSLCNPADPGCAETPILKFCNAAGACGDITPACK